MASGEIKYDPKVQVLGVFFGQKQSVGLELMSKYWAYINAWATDVLGLISLHNK